MSGVTKSKQTSVKTYIVPSFAFIGEMASGKGTYANNMKIAIEREFGVPVYRVPAFSVKIAQVARDVFGAEDGADGKPDRSLLQAIGEKMKEIDPKVWANYLIRDIIANDRVPFVAEGFRSHHETEAFKENFPDVVVVRLETDLKQRMEAYRRVYGRYPTDEQLNHSTEKSVAAIPFDLAIFNNYTLEGLDNQISEIIMRIKNNALAELIRRS